MFHIIEIGRYLNTKNHFIDCNLCDFRIVHNIPPSKIPKNANNNKEVKEHISTDEHILELIWYRRNNLSKYDDLYSRIGPDNYDELKKKIEEVEHDLKTIDELIPEDWKKRREYIDNDFVLPCNDYSESESDDDSLNMRFIN